MNDMGASIGRWATTLAMLMILAGCGGSEEPGPVNGGSSGGTAAGGAHAGDDAGGPASAEPAIKPFDPTTAGSLSGFVRVDGDQPERMLIKLIGEAHCLSVHEDGSYLDDRVLVGPQRGLANAFVWIHQGLERWEYPAPVGDVTLDQRDCLYTPRIFGLRTGQQFTINSSDPIMHNVHIKPNNNRETNWGFPADSDPRTTKFRKAEVMIEVKCDVHAWMKGWIGVLDHPCFAVTGDDGAFDIGDVPPGRYILGVWHEQLGEQRVPIEVGANENLVVDDIVLEL